MLPLLFPLFIAGCATIDVVLSGYLHERQLAEGTVPIAPIQVSDYGYYLFKYIPMLTGDMRTPGSGFKAFSGNIKLELLVDQVMRKSEEMGALIVTDLRSTNQSAWIPYLPIFWLNEIEVSANLSKSLEPAPQ